MYSNCFWFADTGQTDVILLSDLELLLVIFNLQDINNGRRMLVLLILYPTSKLIHTASISTPQDALAFAYLYSFPLYAYALYVKAFSNPQVNIAYPFRSLATPEDYAVVRPNVDTLYTPLFYDLSQGDLEFVIPEFDDRYWLWPWYDLYGNNFGNVGAFYHARRKHELIGVEY